MAPASGRVPPHTTVLVGLRFAPGAAGPASRTLHCAVNGSLKAGLPLALHGAAYTPGLLFEGLAPGSPLFFKPTCVGASSKRPLTLRNPSAIPTSFQWSVPASLAKVLAVTPTSGCVPGKSSFEVDVRFAPDKTKPYSGALTCMIRAGGAPPGAPPMEPHDGHGGVLFFDLSSFDTAVSLPVAGEGSAGAVSLEPPALDCGVLLAGSPAVFELTLLNHSTVRAPLHPKPLTAPSCIPSSHTQPRPSSPLPKPSYIITTWFQYRRQSIAQSKLSTALDASE